MKCELTPSSFYIYPVASTLIVALLLTPSDSRLITLVMFPSPLAWTSDATLRYLGHHVGEIDVRSIHGVACQGCVPTLGDHQDVGAHGMNKIE